MSRQTDRQRGISGAAMTGESEASESDVRLAKCHSDHLKVKDTHTHSQGGGQKKRWSARFLRQTFSLINTFKIELHQYVALPSMYQCLTKV